MSLSAESLRKIDREVAKYPPEQKQSAVMSALIIAQDEKGWLSNETMDYVAKYLGMPPVQVYEVASFYTMYNLGPVGKYQKRPLVQGSADPEDSWAIGVDDLPVGWDQRCHVHDGLKLS